ncbi:MAG: hypothetical protein K2H60_01000 [Muribaculaceae bacterium]|nr:hypothetical protein [Muribaculaceae bacterium]
MEKDIIVIPDLHGRTFWKEAVEKYPDADTIFLGDYLDPYPNEGIIHRGAPRPPQRQRLLPLLTPLVGKIC